MLHDYVYTIPIVKGRLLLSFISSEGRVFTFGPTAFGLRAIGEAALEQVWSFGVIVSLGRRSITSVHAPHKEFTARGQCCQDILFLEKGGPDGLDTVVLVDWV